MVEFKLLTPDYIFHRLVRKSFHCCFLFLVSTVVTINTELYISYKLFSLMHTKENNHDHLIDHGYTPSIIDFYLLQSLL